MKPTDTAATPTMADSLQDYRRSLATSVQPTAAVMLLLVMASAVAQALSLLLAWDQPLAVRLPHLATAGLVFGVAGGSLLLARRQNAQVAALFFCGVTLLTLFGSAWVFGNGVHSASGPALVALIVVMALLVGPRAAMVYTAVAVLGTWALWGAELTGHLPGLTPANTPPGGSHAVIRTIALLMTGWLLVRYGGLFWQLVDSLENALKAQRADAAKLQEDEERMRTLLDHSLTCILIFDGLEGELLYANDQALSRHGCATLQDFEHHCLRHDQPETRAATIRLILRTAAQGAVLLKRRTHHRDGRALWWEAKMDNLRLGGQPCVVCFAHDITDRMAAEQALEEHRRDLAEQVRQRTAELQAEQQRTQAIIEALPITLSLTSLDGTLTLVNQRFEEACGCPRDHLVGRSLEALAARPDTAAAAALINADASWLEPAGSLPVARQLRPPHGAPRDYLITSLAMASAGTMLNLGTDVTPLKQLERELRDAKDEAERLAQVKSDFLAHMSHEIRTPLNGVLGLAQLGARDPGDTAAARQRFARIVRSGRYLLRLVNDVLDYSKLESGKLDIAPRTCELPALVGDVLEPVADRARDKGLQLLHTLDARLPTWVELDSLRVTQVLINLLANAVKFTHHGQVTLKLSQAQPPADPPMLRFEVHDTGVGMSSDALQRIFLPFEQADTSITRRFGGTGLGLSISHRLALLMGGCIDVRSTPGQGSCFTLELPLVVAAPPASAHHVPVTAPAVSGPPLAGWRVLVVDDVAVNRDILEEVLTDAGARVVCAEDGADALRQVHLQGGPTAFELVLMDVQMPVMDGLEATRRLLAQDPELPVVALTAHALPEEHERCRAAGMRDHVTKPLDLDLLLPALLAAGRSARPVSSVRDQAPRASSEAAPQPGHGPLSQTPEPDLPWTVLDRAAALRRCGGREALLQRLLKMFVDQHHPLPDWLNPAHALSEAERSQAVHRLKGTAANLGLVGVSEAAAALEAAGPMETPAAQAALATLADRLRHSLIHLQPAP